MADLCGIYEIRNTANGKCYVGSSKHMNRRLAEHKKLLRGNRHHSIALQCAWNLYGENGFTFKPLAILEECEQFQTEQRLIDQRYDNDAAYNMGKFVKAAMKSRKHTPELLAKMRDGRMAGVNSPSYGLKRSAETRKLQSELKKGKPAKNKGSKHLPESIQKMRNSLKGRESPNKGKHKTHCKNGHEFVESNIYIHPKRGTRSCKTCINIRSHEYQLRRRIS